MMTAQTRSFGAYTSLQQLASYQLLARSLTMSRNNRALANLAGPFKSLIRGRGMEFEDVRLYQAGDDVRTIDWRVTARTGDTYTKQFREEREKPVFIVVDQRQSLFFGSQQAMKSVLACDLAAYIAWASLFKGDKVGGIVFNNQQQKITPALSQRKNVLRFLQNCVELNQQLSKQSSENSLTFITILQELKRQARPGSQLFLISDFYDLEQDSNPYLYELARHCDINVLAVFDPIEQQLPQKGLYPAFNGLQKVLLSGQQPHWQQSFEARQQQLKQQFGQFGISVIPVSTADQPLNVLQTYFGAKR